MNGIVRRGRWRSPTVPPAGALRHQLPARVEMLTIASKREKPHWDARKIREVLVRGLAGDVRIPATSTIDAVLDRHPVPAPSALSRMISARHTCFWGVLRSLTSAVSRR